MTREQAIAHVIALGDVFAREFATSADQGQQARDGAREALVALGVSDGEIESAPGVDIVDDLYGR